MNPTVHEKNRAETDPALTALTAMPVPTPESAVPETAKVSQTQRERTTTGRLTALFLRALLPIGVILAGSLGAVQLVRTSPQARQSRPKHVATLVQTRPVEKTTAPVIVEAMGTVIAAQEITLQPQVSGTVVKLNPAFVPGGRVEAGEVLLVIEPAEYQVAVDRAQATLARNEAQLQSAIWELERLQGLERHAVNKKELDDGYTARAVAEADVAVARASLEQARIDLARTTIRAPFSGIITSEAVDLGAQVTSQTQLATLVGTDAYWVQASIPVDRLSWVTIPPADGQPGSPVHIQQQLGLGTRAEWEGHVVRLLGDLEPQGRMARLLITVPDPLRLKSAPDKRVPLLISSYVDVAIEGRSVRNVVLVGRDELHDGNNVWIMNSDDLLDIRPIEIAFRGREQVLVSGGLTAGERLVVSDLPAPVARMPLRLSQPESAPPTTTSAPTAKPAAPDAGAQA